MVLVEWVPPNVSVDVAIDYMESIGSENVPVTESKAATKRKQQLEYQVPPHDLDANLCDNLSESESQQLKQYVQKVQQNCVGQGSVGRVDNLEVVILTRREENAYEEILKCLKADYAKSCDIISHDTVLRNMLANAIIAKAVLQQIRYNYPKIFVAFTQPFIEPCNGNTTTKVVEDCFDPEIRKLIRPHMLRNFHGLNQLVIRSALLNGEIYDKLFQHLKARTIDVYYYLR